MSQDSGSQHQQEGQLMEVMSSNKPGVESWDTSGTTISEPVKSHLSPAWADSTASARRITSRLRGMLPRGSSPCVSWMRTWHGQKVQHQQVTRSETASTATLLKMCSTASDCCHPHPSLSQSDKQSVPSTKESWSSLEDVQGPQ